MESTHTVSLFARIINRIRSQIAISGGQGFLRIFDIDVSKDQPIKVLKGHQGKVANVAWSPHFGQLLASSSDDCTVRVWNTISDDVQVLTGHTQNTRAVSWNYDIPWLLLSGSWDSSIRVWDIRSNDVIYVIYDHIADVYAIASHPNRPFVYSSCSRDTSIRLWKLQGFVSPMKLKLIFRYKLQNLHSMMDQSHHNSPQILLNSIMSQQANCGFANNEDCNLTQLAGKASMDLVQNLKSPAQLSKLRGVQQLLDYIGIYDGQKEIISTLGAMLQGIPCDLNSRVVHVSDSMSNCKARVQQLSSATTLAYLGTQLAKKEERMMECSKLSLKMGDFRRNCEILMQIGEYNQAMAFAPLVSLEYWREIAIRVAQAKKSENLSDAALYYLAANQIDESVKCLSSSQSFQHAKLVKTLDECKIYRNYSAKKIEQDEKKDQQQEQLKNAESQMEKLKITQNIQQIKILNDIVNQQADNLFLKGKQILAAASHLSVNDINGCLQKLYRANQFYMAYLISSLLSHSSQIQLAQKLAQRAQRFRLSDLSANIYSTFEMKTKLGLLIARLRNMQHTNVQDLAQKYKIKTQDQYKKECEAVTSSGSKQIFNYIMSGDIQNAARLSVRVAKQAFNEKKVDHFVNLFDVFQTLQETRINKIEEIGLKAEVLMYAAAIGALKSIFLGFIRVLTPLIGTVFSICEHQKIKPAFNLSMLQNIQSDINDYMMKQKKKMLAGKMQQDSNERAKYLTEIKVVFDKQEDEQLYHNILKALRMHYKETKCIKIEGNMIKQGNNSFLTIGSTLPINVNVSGVRKSIFSMDVIKGLYFVLEDGTSHMSIQEALQWAEVNRFSPLNNGCRINPF